MNTRTVVLCVIAAALAGCLGGNPTSDAQGNGQPTNPDPRDANTDSSRTSSAKWIHLSREATVTGITIVSFYADYYPAPNLDSNCLGAYDVGQAGLLALRANATMIDGTGFVDEWTLEVHVHDTEHTEAVSGRLPLSFEVNELNWIFSDPDLMYLFVYPSTRPASAALDERVALELDLLVREPATVDPDRASCA
jgi:hypothetical protein